MVLHTVAGVRVAEDAEDLRAWLRSLTGGPEITATEVLACRSEVHDEPATWFFVEADARSALARRRCLACGQVADSLDSSERWTHPPMWSCSTCQQSIAELAVGLSTRRDPERADGELVISWAALGARCVACGHLDGLTDFLLPDLGYDEALAVL